MLQFAWTEERESLFCRLVIQLPRENDPWGKSGWFEGGWEICPLVGSFLTRGGSNPRPGPRPGFLPPRSTPTPRRGSLIPISPRSRHGDPFPSRSTDEGVSFPRNPFDGESYPLLSPLPSPGGLLPSPISKGKRTPLSLPALRKGSFFPSDFAFPSSRRRPCVAHATRRDERHGMAHLAQRSGRAGAPHAHPANVRTQEEGKHAWDEKKAEETDAGRRRGAQHEFGWKDERVSNEARLSFAHVAQARNARRNRWRDGSRGSKEDEWVDATLQCSVHVHVA